MYGDFYMPTWLAIRNETCKASRGSQLVYSLGIFLSAEMMEFESHSKIWYTPFPRRENAAYLFNTLAYFQAFLFLFFLIFK